MEILLCDFNFVVYTKFMSAKILIAEDNEVLVKLYTSSLQNDYELQFARNGIEALNLLEKWTPDIMILDIMMPDMDGYELISALKNDKRYKDIPVIFSSAKSGVTNRTSGYEFGAIGYIEKPFEIAELRSIVRSTVRQFGKNKPVLEFKGVKLNLLNNKVECNGELLDFTLSEFNILAKLVTQPDRVFSREQLLDCLKGDHLNVSDRVVDSHVSAIRKKLKKSELQIKSKYGSGYFLKS